jgi:hypothetical protein
LLQCRQRATFLFDDDPVLSRVLCLASFPSVGFISKPRSLLTYCLICCAGPALEREALHQCLFQKLRSQAKGAPASTPRIRCLE